MSAYACPCCGAPLPDPPDVKALTFLTFAAVGQALIRALAEAYPGALTIEQLIFRAYQGREPATPENSVRVSLGTLRPRLAEAGWRVRNVAGTGRGVTGVYRLEKIA